jgi:uncharacterized protein (DUF1800 family)
VPIGTPAAAHLLRRAGFGGTAAEIQTYAAMERAAAVDAILDVSAAAADVRPTFLDDPAVADWDRLYRLQLWWLDRMRTSTAPLQEKMTLCWHGHFVSGQDKVGDATIMYGQNKLFRAEGLGSFRPLVQHMALDPAMLLYLDNGSNVKGAPNENFARELMELFLLGVNQYTQADVVAAARAWTGYNSDPNDRTKYLYRDTKHDKSSKTFMGITKSGVAPDDWTGPGIIDSLLTTDPKRTTGARFIAAKLWSFFAYPNPDSSVLDMISAAFMSTPDLDITALLRAIFMHDNFWSPQAQNALVRSPVEFVVAAMKMIGVRTGNASTVADPQSSPPWWMDEMGQQLFYPPNVAGWKQNSYWISTTATWARANYARDLSWHAHDKQFLAGTVLPTSVPQAVQAAFDAFGIDSPSAATRSKLETWLTAERALERAPTYSWTDYGYVNLITLTMLTSDFQLA